MPATQVGFLRQCRALFLRNLSVQRRQKSVTVCQLLIPFILIALVGMIQVIVDNVVSGRTLNLQLLPADRNASVATPCQYVNGSALCRLSYWLQTVPGMPNSTLNESRIFGPDEVLFSLPMYWYTTSDDSLIAPLGALPPDTARANASGFLGLTRPQVVLPINSTNETVSVPFYQRVNGSAGDVNAQLATIIRTYYTLAPPKTNSPDSTYKRVYGTKPNSEAQNATVISWIMQRSYTLVRPAAVVTFHNVTRELLNVTIEARYFEVDSADYQTQRIYETFNQLSNALLLTRLGRTAPLPRNFVPPIRAHFVNMPQNATSSVFDITSIIGGYCFSFAASFLLPVFIGIAVKDKQEKQLLMMQMSGLRPRIYWIISYLYNYVLYIGIVVIIFVTSLAFQMRMFMQTSPLILLLFFFVWGHNMNALAFLMSTFFNKTRTAIVIGYLFVVITVDTSNVLNSLNIFSTDSVRRSASGGRSCNAGSLTACAVAQSPPFVYMLVPSFAFYRAIFLMVRDVGRSHAWPDGGLGGWRLKRGRARRRADQCMFGHPVLQGLWRHVIAALAEPGLHAARLLSDAAPGRVSDERHAARVWRAQAMALYRQ